MIKHNLLLISHAYAGDRGYFDHCWEAFKNLYGVTNGKHVLFIPYANAYNWEGFAHERMPHFEAHGIKMKSILAYEDPRAAVADDNLAGIFMAGGNTFKLLKYLYDYELIEPIQQRVNTGLPYAGVSAGAVVACPGIYTTNDMPIVNPKTLKSFNFIPFQINAHFIPGALMANHRGETREERIRQFHTEHEEPVIGLRESNWLEIHDNSLELCGEDSAELFGPGKEHEALIPGVITEPVLSRLINFSNVSSKLG
jgi:dipeptidase E